MDVAVAAGSAQRWRHFFTTTADGSKVTSFSLD
jgi:hypothetical protein